MLERMRHYATVRFKSLRGRKTCRRVLESGNRETKRDGLHACVCLCVCVHICRWKMESKGKGFTEDDNIIEKKVRNTHLWYHKNRTKIFTLNAITV